MHVLPVHCHPSPLASCQAWVVFQVPPVMGLQGGQVCPSLNQGLEQGQGRAARHVPARAIAPSAQCGVDGPLDSSRTYGRVWWGGEGVCYPSAGAGDTPCLLNKPELGRETEARSGWTLPGRLDSW